MNQTPQTLKGFRDFLPEEKRKRDYVLGKIKETFELFGFEPLETPTLEYADLLLGKYGTEADKLVYTFEDRGDRRVGLRYDQTVPTARVLYQYQNDLPRFFRRYQTQNVFRADKPQKGRYREFTQCDIDIFGSTSPIADAEILACTYAAYKNIGFENIIIKINDRKSLVDMIADNLGFSTLQINEVDERILNGYSDEKKQNSGAWWWEAAGLSVIQTLDKLDKLPESLIINELNSKIKNESRVRSLIESLKEEKVIPSTLQKQIDFATELGVPRTMIEYSPFLARGLDYYTGMIFEVIIPGFEVGSVGGGGRYDNLIADLSGLQMPAVGMAFGFDRTVEAADQLGLIPSKNSSSKVLVTVFDESLQSKSLDIAKSLRSNGIKTELYPALDKMDKQFKLANRKNIPFVIIIGGDEANQNKVALKNMATGEQQTLALDEAVSQIQSTK